MSTCCSKGRVVEWCSRMMVAVAVATTILYAGARPAFASGGIPPETVTKSSAEVGEDGATAMRPLASWHYYWGARKGITWEGGEYHHYVEFNTNRCGDVQIVTAPLPSSRWGFVNGSNCRKYRVGYSWPGNLWDPFPAWAWSIRVWE